MAYVDGEDSLGPSAVSKDIILTGEASLKATKHEEDRAFPAIENYESANVHRPIYPQTLVEDPRAANSQRVKPKGYAQLPMTPVLGRRSPP